MAPKQKNVEEIVSKLDRVLEAQEEMRDDLKTLGSRVYTLDLWKAKVEDTVSGAVKVQEAKTPLEKYGLNGVIILGLLWVIVNLVSGGKVPWFF